MTSGREELTRALQALGETLAIRGQAATLVVVGGGSLLLLGQLDRPTADIDVLAVVDGERYRKADPLPQPVATAALEVSSAYGLAVDWLNPGPTSPLDLGLPAGFRERVSVRPYGALEIRFASRYDQIHFKLYAAVDRGERSVHTADLERLRPTTAELRDAAAWARTHDPSEPFAAELRRALSYFGVEASDAGD